MASVGKAFTSAVAKATVEGAGQSVFEAARKRVTAQEHEGVVTTSSGEATERTVSGAGERKAQNRSHRRLLFSSFPVVEHLFLSIAKELRLSSGWSSPGKHSGFLGRRLRRKDGNG